MALFLSDNEVNRTIGADETGLMIRVIHVNFKGTEGAPDEALWDYLSQNICILPSENA